MRTDSIPVRLLLVLLASIALSTTTALAQNLVRGPYVQSVTETSATILWKTGRAADSVVEYGTSSALVNVVVDAEQGVDHAVTLIGLSPDTTYSYRVRSGGDVLAPVATFRTAAPATETDFRFVVFGDPGEGQPMQDTQAAQIAAFDPRFVLLTGDVITPHGDPRLYDAQFFQPYADLLGRVAFWPVLGNHDYDHEDGQPYLDVFHLPTNNAEQTERYYAFDHGNAHFIALDPAHDITPGSPQYVWLINELKHNRREWNFCMLHYPAYSSGFGGLDEISRSVQRYLTPIFEMYGVDIVFAGHHHHYERHRPLKGGAVDPVGVHYITTGGGGAALLDVFGSARTAYFEKMFHFLRVAIDGSTLTLEAVRLDDSVADTLVLESRAWNGPTAVAEADRVLALSFSEGAGGITDDASIYDHTAVLGSSAGSDPGDPAWDSNGALSGGGCLYFEGSQPRYVTVPNDQGQLDPASGLTLMAWVRGQQPASWNAVISGGDYDYALYLSHHHQARGYLRGFTPAEVPRTGTYLEPGRWSHLAMTYDDGTVSLYFNGELQTVTEHAGTFAAGIDELRVGWDGYRGDQFRGWIDEVQVFRTSLSVDQIRLAMVDSLEQVTYPQSQEVEPRVPATIDDLVCELSFDEASGQAVLDSSPRGNDGWLGSGSGSEAADPTRTGDARHGSGALSFDGSKDVVTVFDDRGDFDVNQEWTSMAWIRFADSGPWRAIFSGGRYRYALYLDDDASLRAFVRDLYPASTGNTSRRLLPGNWHHVALVKRDEALMVYIDGERERVTTTDPNSTMSPVNFFQVGYDGFRNDYFRGLIDEVKVYRRGLDITEIRTEMTSTFGIPYTGGGDPPPPPPPPPPALLTPILDLRFDEADGQTLTDGSGDGHDGYLGSQETVDANDPARVLGSGIDGGNCLDFGPARYATIRDTDGAFDLDQRMTVMAWVRYDSLSSWSPIISGGAYVYGLYLTPQGRIRGYCRDLAPRATPKNIGSIPANTWTHLAMVKDGSTIRLYIDGVQVSASTHAGSLTPVGQIRVGHDGYGSSNFDGRIDEVRVFDEALTTSEIVDEMHD